MSVLIKAICDLGSNVFRKRGWNTPVLLPQHIWESCLITKPVFLSFSFHPSLHSHLPPFAHFTFTPAPSFPGESPNEPNSSMFIGSVCLFLLPFFLDGRFCVLQGRKWKVSELWDFQTCRYRVCVRWDPEDTSVGKSLRRRRSSSSRQWKPLLRLALACLQAVVAAAWRPCCCGLRPGSNGALLASTCGSSEATALQRLAWLIQDYSCWLSLPDPLHAADPPPTSMSCFVITPIFITLGNKRQEGHNLYFLGLQTGNEAQQLRGRWHHVENQPLPKGVPTLTPLQSYPGSKSKLFFIFSSFYLNICCHSEPEALEIGASGAWQI